MVDEAAWIWKPHGLWRSVGLKMKFHELFSYILQTKYIIALV